MSTFIEKIVDSLFDQATASSRELNDGVKNYAFIVGYTKSEITYLLKDLELSDWQMEQLRQRYLKN